MKQNTQEWLDFRRNKIGASDAAAIMGVSPWHTPYQKWEEKVFGKDLEQNTAMKRGSYYENEARESFEKEFGISVMPKVIVSSERDWQMASLDGVSFDGTVFTEIKVPNHEAHELAKKGIIADYYNIQMQHQYSVDRNLKQGLYSSYCPKTKETVIVEVKKDELFIEQMLEEEEKFYQMMLNKEAPPLCDRDYRIQGDKWIELALETKELGDYAKSVQEQYEEKRKELISLSDGQNCIGGGIKLTRSLPKGLVDYKSIPELMGVNLEMYRKPASERWTLTACK